MRHCELLWEYYKICDALGDFCGFADAFTFSDKERGAFNALKAAFTKAPVLQYPNQDREFQLETDASEFAIRGVLSVKGDDGDFRLVAYMSHSMTLPE